MVEAMANLPDNIIGFEAVGEFEDDDYEDAMVSTIDTGCPATRGFVFSTCSARNSRATRTTRCGRTPKSGCTTSSTSNASLW